VVLEQSDINNMKALHSVAVDIHEVLDTLVLNIGHEHNELAEFVQQLSECTASADDVIELKAVVECMARVTGVSEHKAEQLITDFIGKEGVELERLKREQRLADDKIRELLLARDQMAEMYDSPYQNQLPYLNCVAETMRSECSKYKRDLNAISKRLSERVNAKVAQAIQQSLVDKHQQNNKAQFGLPSTEGQDTKPGASVLTRFNGQISAEMPQPVVDNGGTVTEAAAAALEDETNFKRYQDIQTELKDAAISGPPPLPAKLGSKYTRVQWQDQLSNSNKPLDVTVKSVLRSKSPFEQLAEPLSMQQQTTTTTQQQEPSVATSSSGKISTEMLQLVADDVSTVLAAAAPTAALQDETEPKRHQDTHTQVKDTAISSRSSIARMPIETDSNDTRSQPEDQLPKLNKPLDVAVTSVSRSESPSEQVAEPLCRQQLTTTQQQEQYGIDDAMPQQSIWPIIKCVVVGHESAQAYKLIRAYFDKRMGSSVTLTPDGISVDEHVPVKNGTFNCKLCLSKCSEAKQLKHIVCDIIVICFSVIDEVSYQEVRKVWVKQIKQEFPEIPYWLVGTQADQRQTTGVRHFQVEYEQGLQLCRKIGAVAYFECSELDDVGAEAMFNCAVQHVVHKLKYFSRPSIK
jgi:hypothetical protein